VADLPGYRCCCAAHYVSSRCDFTERKLAITAAVLSAATASASVAADALCQYMASVRSTAASRGGLLTVHAEACSGQGAGTANATTAGADAAAVASTGAAAAAVASTGAAAVMRDCGTAAAAIGTTAGIDGAAHSSEEILVQLVHAVTGVKAAKQCLFDLSALQQLHTRVNGSESCALLNMLIPSNWGAQKQQQK
jgi:hypothetical protein